jgi:hypothetical protein
VRAAPVKFRDGLGNTPRKRLLWEAACNLPACQAELMLKLAMRTRRTACHPIAKFRSIPIPKSPNTRNEIRLALLSRSQYIGGSVRGGLVEAFAFYVSQQEWNHSSGPRI